jgi:hypothetical protein
MKLIIKSVFDTKKGAESSAPFYYSMLLLYA